MIQQTQVDEVLAHVDTVLGEPREWEPWPGGWPNEISTALVDAVFSARATYKTKYGHGVFEWVSRWREQNANAVNDLKSLCREIESIGPDAWGKALGSEQHAPRRNPNSPGGPTKTAAVCEAAHNLIEQDINTAADIDTHEINSTKRAMKRVSGVGFATTNYFLMNLGKPGVKPDTMIHRFIKDATDERLSDARAAELIEACAQVLGVKSHDLDYAIWGSESSKAQGGRG